MTLFADGATTGMTIARRTSANASLARSAGLYPVSVTMRA
jgi:hypothetical protein